MNIRRYKPYLSFLSLIALFLVLVIYTTLLYINWEKPLEKEAYELEVSLPIIDWQKYSSLSKQYESTTMK